MQTLGQLLAAPTDRWPVRAGTVLVLVLVLVRRDG